MSLPSFQGICGLSRARNKPCRLAWAGSGTNLDFPTAVGNYPSDLLPASKTSWYASSSARFDFEPAQETFGPPAFGSIIESVGLGIFTQTQVFHSQSYYKTIFAKTENRFDIEYKLTQDDIDQILLKPNEARKIVEIDVGEYIFHFIAVTTEKGVVTNLIDDNNLTSQEISDIKITKETKEDILFQKILNLEVPNNLIGQEPIVPNELGLEYRFDNGDPKSTEALIGTSILNNNKPSTQKDASSKKVAVNFGEETPSVGDTIYLSYIAVKDHYLRQAVYVDWFIQAAQSTEIVQAYPSVNRVRVINYKFFEWDINTDTNPDSPKTRIGGWRMVESFNIPTNFVAAVNNNEKGNFIGDFIIAQDFRGALSLNVQYMPVGENFDLINLQTFINDQAFLSTYSVQLDANLDDVRCHENKGAQGSQFDYQFSSWYRNGNVLYHPSLSEASKHVFYNVHPQALQKRDVDKFGIERSLAEEIENTINNGGQTYFPFMDDPSVDNPTLGCKTYLSSSNCKFDPFKPISGYSTANADITANALNINNESYVLADFSFSSNNINEKFDKNTKILVENHFTERGYGLRLLAVQGTLGAKNSVSCVSDPSFHYAFAAHVNADNFLVINPFKTSEITIGMNTLFYRPDLGNPPVVNNNDPNPSQYEPMVGYSGMLGDSPGFTYGKTVSVAQYASTNSFNYQTTDLKYVKEVFRVEEDQIQLITISPLSPSSTKLIINVKSGYFGRTEIKYSYSGESFQVLLIFKDGESIYGIVDSITIDNTISGTNILIVDHRWMKADSIEVVGRDISKIKIQNVVITQVNDERVKDFTDNLPRSELSDSDRILNQSTFLEKSLFFRTDIATIAEDNTSRMYIFFNDQRDGISCLHSNDYGFVWYFHYGIVQKRSGVPAKNPFVISNFLSINQCLLFYMLEGKILCKKILYDTMELSDAFLVEDFDKDIYKENEDQIIEQTSVFTEEGRLLRYRNPSYVVAGDLADAEFWALLGKYPSAGVSDPSEDRLVFKKRPDRTVYSENEDVLKMPISVGTTTAFANRDVENVYFSAYVNSAGIIRFFFMGESNGAEELQCHFSSDGGQNWFDLWEYLENFDSRLRYDTLSKTQFIDRSATAGSSLDKRNPLESNQQFEFGINIHGLVSSDVQSPYVFLQPTVEKVFIFYIYKECLLCKIIDDSLFEYDPNVKMKDIKQSIEKDTMSFFVDGNLNNPDLTKEDKETIIVPISRGLTGPDPFTQPFNSSRSILPQRVSAYVLPNNNVRVFYIPEGIAQMRASIWNGNYWSVEELMKDPVNYGFPSFDSLE